MNSLRHRNRMLFFRWTCYIVLLFACAVFQSTPGFLCIGGAKPLLVLPMCLVVSVWENETDAAFFGALGGLLWDFIAARTVGFYTIGVMLLCFCASCLVRLYLQPRVSNFMGVVLAGAFIASGMDFLFNYAMRGYTEPGLWYITQVLPTVVLTVAVSPLLYLLGGRIAARFELQS